MNSPTRVLLVDDHAMFRAGVRAELGSAVDVVGEAADVDGAVAAVLAHRPDVVLLDVHLPGGGGAELVDAIRRVADGDAVFSPRLAGFVLDAFAGTIEISAVDEDLDRLTEREREVMRLIARGYAYKEVAKELFISIKTVETHMSSVLRKLQLSSRHELTRWASDRRLL
jgi:DNA-binding NarL/FixJ family response regulator